MEEPMRPVERGQLWVMRIHTLLFCLPLLGAGAIAEAILSDQTDLPRGLVLGPLALVALFAVLVSPGRRYRALGYSIDAEELRIRRGTWVRSETVVPLERVQHIDISEGPLERAFRVCRLVLHTAGTMHSLVQVPGLSRSDAEKMRDEIRARIRQDAA